MTDNRGTPNKIEFRLKDQALLRELERRAEQEGQSRSEVARDLLVAVLRDEFRANFRDDLAALHQQVSGLRSDMARLVTLLLVNLNANTGADLAEMARWEKEVMDTVRKVLRPGT